MAKKQQAKEETVSADDIMEKLEKKFGKGTMVVAADTNRDVENWVHSGSITLDKAIGHSIPKDGRATCILGKESSSKTTLALHIIAEEQKKGGLCAFLDVEDTFSNVWAQTVGVDLKRLHLVDRESLIKSLGIKDRSIISGEEWLELTCKILESSIYDIVVLDSVAALIPNAEIAYGIAGGRLAGVASMMSKAYRAINASLTTSKTGFVYLNQYRMNPGGYVTLVEPGGEAWKYLQDLKIEIWKSIDKDDDGAYGMYVNGTVTKSKIGIAGRKFKYYLEYGKGIQKVYEIMTLSIANGSIVKSGSWYELNGAKMQGEDAVKQFLLDNPDYMQELEDKIMKS